ncbi:MAG TPA: TonB-dependent receptor [Cellvibrionaceae bacterium]
MKQQLYCSLFTALRPYRMALVWGGFLMTPQLAYAAIDYFELDPEQLLGAQVLSVSKHLESVAEAPAAIYVVTDEDIQRSGVTTVPDALRMVPGVDVARNDSNTWAVSIRGFNSSLANKLLVMIDGRTIYNPVFGGAFWEAHDLFLADIERIEVIRGPGGALWGANAVNGVINIITKSADATQGNLISGLAGNEELGTVTARHGGKLADDAYYRVYSKAFKRDASQALDGREAYDGWNGLRSGFRIDWPHAVTVQGDIYRNHTQQRRANYALVEPYAPIDNQLIEYSGANILGRWTQQYPDRAQLNVQAYIDWTQRDEPINFLDRRTTYDLEAQYDLAPLGMQHWTLGAGLRYLTDEKISQSMNASFAPEARQDAIYQAFAQDKITLVEDTAYLTLGAKAEHTELSRLDIQPNARVQVHIDDNKSLWLAASRAVRTPTPFETDLTTTLDSVQGARFALVPNENFAAEELTAYELGYRQQISATLFTDITTFYNDYKKLQSFRIGSGTVINNGVDPIHAFIPVRFTNEATGISKGFEAVLGWSPHADVKFTASFTHFELDLRTVDLLQESLEGANPVDQLAVRMFWNITSDWTFDTSAYYVDALPFGDIDSYVRVDVNFGGRINKDLRFNIIAQNLFDPAHQELKQSHDENSSEVQRSVLAKLTWMF